MLASVVTYIGATFAILGSVPERLRFAPTYVAQVAASFAGTLAPASIGGLALNARYLQKSGVDAAVAVPAVGLNVIAGVAMHIMLLALLRRVGRHLGVRCDPPSRSAGAPLRRRGGGGAGRDRVP